IRGRGQSYRCRTTRDEVGDPVMQDRCVVAAGPELVGKDLAVRYPNDRARRRKDDIDIADARWDRRSMQRPEFQPPALRSVLHVKCDQIGVMYQQLVSHQDWR